MKPSTAIPALATLLACQTPVRGQAPPLILDDITGHFWIGEDWGSNVTAEPVEFQGRNCLRCKVTSAEAGWALVRTDRFSLESWKPQFAQLAVDVHCIGTGPTGKLKLELRGASFDPVLVPNLVSTSLPENQWVTVRFPLAQLQAPVGAVSFVIDSIGTRTPTVFLDNVRLEPASGSPRPWDSMDQKNIWFFNPGFCDFRNGAVFPGLDPISPLVLPSPINENDGNDGCALQVQWCNPSAERAEVSTSGRLGQDGLDLDLGAFNRVTFRAAATSTEVNVGIFLFDGKKGFSPPLVRLPAAGQWQSCTFDLPWPPDVRRDQIQAIALIVDGVQGKTGVALFDQIRFSSAPAPVAPSGYTMTLESFDQLDATNHLGGSKGEFQFPQAQSEPVFEGIDISVDTGGFARGITVREGRDFAGLFTSLNGRTDFSEFTFDARRWDFVKIRVRSLKSEKGVLKVEFKGGFAGELERFQHTAFRLVTVDFSSHDWVDIVLPMDVENRTEWTHNWKAPDRSQLKELAILAEKHFNTLPFTFEVDRIEFIDRDVPAEPVLPTAGDTEFLRFILKENLEYFLRYVHPVTGLVPDREAFSDLGGLAATAFALTAWPAAAEEGLITKTAAFEFARKALTTLANPALMGSADNPQPGLAGVDGVFYRYLDIRTGQRKLTPGFDPPDASPVDTALLVFGGYACRGAMTVANGYTAAQQDEIASLCSQIINRVNWRKFVVNDGGTPRMLLGWKPENLPGYKAPFLGGFASGAPGDFACYDYSTDEIYLITLAGMSAANPAFRLPPSFMHSWIRYRAAFGGEVAVQSFFGSAFAHQFASLWLPIKDFAPDAAGVQWWRNNRSALRSNMIFCASPEVQTAFATFRISPPASAPAAGLLTPHEDVDGRYAGARGAPPAGLYYFIDGATDALYAMQVLSERPGEPNAMNGLLAPYGAGSSFYFIPAEAVAMLRHAWFNLKFREQGRGFSDSGTLSVAEFLLAEQDAGRRAVLNKLHGRFLQHVQFAINQGPMVISIFNHLTGGKVHTWTMSSPEVRQAVSDAFPAIPQNNLFAHGLNFQPGMATGLLTWPQFSDTSRYRVEASADLSSWTVLATNLSAPWFRVNASLRARFFRVIRTAE